MNQSQNPWFREPIESVFEKLNSSEAGLDAAQAQERLTQYGPNELQGGSTISAWGILLDQFKNILIIILLLATGLSIVLGHGIEAVAIAVIVLFAVILGFVQEYRAERAIEALREMAAPLANVLRDGEEIKIAAREVVPGDIIFLRAGDKIPADARLVETFNLQADEAALTGESQSVEKNPATLDNPALAIGDRKNMVYSGTSISYGRGRAVVTATGMQTEFGKIAQLLQTVERGKTPLQENLDKVGHVLARAALVVVLIIVALGVVRGQPILEMIIFGVALAVAVVPEALPAVVTISLAIGVQRMVKRHALIRRLPAVETLGSVSVICSDKTGTLTRDEMTARKVFVDGQVYDVSGAGYAPEGQISLNGEAASAGESLLALARAGVLASDASLALDEAEAWQIKGDPTEGALVVLAAKLGMEKADLDAKFVRKDEIPFTSETKRMTTLVEMGDGLTAFSKGAPEILLESCTHILTAQGETALDEAGREQVLSAGQEMARNALRVLGLAYKPNAARETAEQGMVFLGLVGMIDPPRSEVKAAIEVCEQAGIKPVMITGDHPLTAEAIARELGILKNGRVVTGAEVDEMSQEDFEREVEHIEVYARVSPSHKLQVVTALQKRGYSVAMTGDGVNDAPALKKADIGVAMGITGTEVSKEAAVMILTDDDFSTIVHAVELGRGLYDNLKKYIRFQVGLLLGYIATFLGSSFLNVLGGVPFVPVQTLFMNFTHQVFQAVGLGYGKPAEGLMERKPRPANEPLLSQALLVWLVVVGLVMGGGTLAVISWASGVYDEQVARTMGMIAFSVSNVAFSFATKDERRSVFSLDVMGDRPFLYASALSIVTIILMTEFGLFRRILDTTNLDLEQWLVCIVVGLLIIPVSEIRKLILRKPIDEAEDEVAPAAPAAGSAAA